MTAELYETVSLIARYIFVLLGGIIVLRVFVWLRKDRKEKHRRLKNLPDAGNIGEFSVLYGSALFPEGTCFPVPREGTLGSRRTCDLVLPEPSVASRHLDFSFQDKLGLLIMPASGCTVSVNGTEMNCRSNPRQYPMVHGSVLQIGELVLRLRLFAGVNISHPAAMQENDACDPAGATCCAVPEAACAVPVRNGPQNNAFPMNNTQGAEICGQAGTPWNGPIPDGMPFGTQAAGAFGSSGFSDTVNPREDSSVSEKQAENRSEGRPRRRSDRWKEDWSE